ncbi:hypothetical protein KAW50_03525 [candidate division WOR-3 bacterium]|nr:hypothetical protein [candidate division WOR-3 bacterium]
MVRINWLRTWEEIDKDTLQEELRDLEGNYMFKGRLIKYCPTCKRWVMESDYQTYCSEGYHEYSEEINLLDDRVKA